MSSAVRRSYTVALLAAAVFLWVVGCGGQPSAPGGSNLPVGGGAGPASIAAQTPPFVPGQILVKFADSVPASARDAAIARLGAQKLDEIGGIHTLVLNVPSGQELAKVSEFSKLAGVQYAEPDYTLQAVAAFTPNDQYFGDQWGFQNSGLTPACTGSVAGTASDDIDATDAWAGGWGGSSSVRIAMLDTGLQFNHPDFAPYANQNSRVLLSKSFVGGNASDGNGHGTHTAGIASADTNNGIGVAGTAWQSSLIIGKVLNNNGSGSVSSSANGITWAADNGANVISMSYGYSASSESSTEASAISYAWGKGVVLVAAAGNSSSSSPNFWPAGNSNVVSVAATDNNDTLASFSNFGSWVDVAAPGVCIASTYKGSSYVYLSGTSMATPYVSGVAALVWAQTGLARVSPNNQTVVTQIESTANPLGKAGVDWKYGRVNACKAVVGTCSHN